MKTIRFIRLLNKLFASLLALLSKHGSMKQFQIIAVKYNISVSGAQSSIEDWNLPRKKSSKHGSIKQFQILAVKYNIFVSGALPFKVEICHEKNRQNTAA